MRTPIVRNDKEKAIIEVIASGKERRNDPLHYALRHETAAGQTVNKMSIGINCALASAFYADLGMSNDQLFHRAKFHMKELFGIELRR